MQLKFLQLNIWTGTCFPAIKEFLENNFFDILCFQEVAGPQTYFHNNHCDIDCFNELIKVLRKTHLGKLAPAQTVSSNTKTSYFGNAIFYSKDLKLLRENVLTLYKRETPFPSDSNELEKIGRNALHLKLIKDSNEFDVITTQLALTKGTKIEQSHQTQQNDKLIAYIKNLKNPFVLTGDFNLDSNQPTILKLEEVAINLTKKYNVRNTIDPTVHKSWEKIKPGFAIDYIFVSKDIKVINFKVLDNIHISDHFALVAEIDL